MSKRERLVSCGVSGTTWSAQILGQRWPLERNAVHWRMLKYGIRAKNTREIIGQLPRLVFGGVKSFVGTVPIGNTGGADVPALRTMELPRDMAAILQGEGQRLEVA